MLLDNLFAIVGVPGTALIMLGIVAFVGVAPATALMCPRDLARLPRSRRGV